MKKVFFLFLIIITTLIAAAAEFDVKNVKIIIEKPASKEKKLAVKELKEHLELISSQKVSKNGNGYRFVFRDSAKDNIATWSVSDNETVFTGKGRYVRYAVYDFLEKNLGVVWVSPFDTAYKTQKTINIPNKKGEFRNKLIEHFYWGAPRSDPDFTSVVKWIKRMKTDVFISWYTPHAFVGWWTRYGKAHPEFFAVNNKGKRGELSCGVSPNDPAAAASKKKDTFIQLCISANGLVDFIIKKHLSGRYKHRNINLSHNDSIGNQCFCPACMELDVKRTRIPEWKILTDRLLNLANRAARKAAKLNPPLDVHFLAYCQTEEPPLREKVEPNILITFVPIDFRLKKITEQLNGWIKAGAKKIRFRPNLPCYLGFSSLPLGYEKHAYLYLKRAMAYPEVVGCNIDNLGDVSWGTFGFALYVMGKTMLEPKKRFENWEREYLSAFGNAASEMGNYYAYWRKNWKKRIRPDLKNIYARGKYFNISRGVMMKAKQYYTEKDFDITDNFLCCALKQKLTPEERKRIEAVKLVNQHARLTFRAATLKGNVHTIAVRKLLKFRQKHNNFKEMNFKKATMLEKRWGDLTRTKMGETTSKYDLPVIQTSTFWFFKIDEKNVGVNKKWFNLKYPEYNKWKEQAATHTYWEGSPRMPLMSAKLKEKLKLYNGFGWYAQRLSIPADWKKRKVFLLLTVDDGCNIYVNGKKLLERHWTKAGDESRLIELEITSAINWQSPNKTDVIIRVEDIGGAGGIYKRIYLVSKK
jgi:uncharacterized protein DUF4838